jgi:hypothetical protein
MSYVSKKYIKKCKYATTQVTSMSNLEEYIALSDMTVGWSATPPTESVNAYSHHQLEVKSGIPAPSQSQQLPPHMLEQVAPYWPSSSTIEAFCSIMLLNNNGASSRCFAIQFTAFPPPEQLQPSCLL